MNSNYNHFMKKIITLLVVFILMISFSLAADLEVEDESELNFEIDYSELEDDEEKVSITHKFTIKNSGEDNEDITISIENVNSALTVDFSDSDDQNFILSENDEKEIELTIIADISETEEYGDINDVFEIELTSNTSDDETFKFDSDIKPMLDIKEVEFTIGSKKSSNFDEDDSNDEETDFTVEPGDEVELFFELNNKFDEDFKDGTFDVDIEVTLDNSYFGEDIDEKISFELDSNEETEGGDEKYSVSFDVPLYARANKEYEIEIKFEAEDENDVKLETTWIAQLEVDRDENDVRIEKIEFSSEEVKCGDPVYLFVTSTNFGSEDQPNSKIIVEDLNIDIDEEDEFSLGYGYEEDENTHVSQFEFEVPTTLETGEYDILTKLYYDYNDISDQGYGTLTVVCETEEVAIESTEELTAIGEEEEEVVTIDSSVNNSYEGYSFINTIEKSYSQEDFEIALTIVFIVLIIMSVISLLAVLFVRSKKR